MKIPNSPRTIHPYLLCVLIFTCFQFSFAQDEKACGEAYTNFYNLRVAKENDKAYEAAKGFLQKCPTANEYRTAAEKYVKAYEMLQRRKSMYEALKASKYDEAFVTGKQVALDYKDDPQIFYDLTRAGSTAADSGNNKNNSAAADYARIILGFAEQDKLPKNVTKDQLIAEANYTLGTVSEKPQDRIAALIKATQTQHLGKFPGLYYKLAILYQNGEYTEKERAYNKLISDKTKTPTDPEVKKLLKEYYQFADRLIDALARCLALSKTPEFDSHKKSAMPSLITLYKFRNKSEKGLQEFIDGILSKPLPLPDEPIDYFPAN